MNTMEKGYVNSYENPVNKYEEMHFIHGQETGLNETIWR